MKLKNIFILTWKKFSIILLIFIACVFFHNIFSGLTGIEEPVFFIISTMIIPIYLLISGVYSLMEKLKKKKRKK